MKKAIILPIILLTLISNAQLKEDYYKDYYSNSYYKGQRKKFFSGTMIGVSSTYTYTYLKDIKDGYHKDEGAAVMAIGLLIGSYFIVSSLRGAKFPPDRIMSFIRNKKVLDERILY